MLLQYEIGINSSHLKRQLRSVEGELVALQKRVNSASQASIRSAKAGSARAIRGESAAVGKRVVDSESRDRLRGIQRESRDRIRESQRASNARIRDIKREERERTRSFLSAKQQQERLEQLKSRYAARRDSILGARRTESNARWGRAAGAGVSAARGAIGVGIGAAGVLGGVAAYSSLSNEIGMRSRASSIANQANAPERKGDVYNATRNVRGATGEQAAGALEAWQTVTGDLDLGLKQLQRLSTIALATGTAMDELGAASGNAYNAIKDEITDPQKRLEALDAILRSAAAQGQLGAVEIKQMATEMASLAAAGSQFGEDRQASIIRSIAMAQVARAKGGAPSAAEAVTATERFNTDITEKQKLLKDKYGVDIWADKSHTTKKDQDVIVRDILRSTKGDQSKLGDIFGAYGIRSMRGFANIYSSAEKREKGSGEAAVQAEFERFTGAAATESSLQERFESRLEDADIRLAAAADDFNEAIGTRLVPVITTLIPKFEALIPTLANVTEKGASLAGWFAQNPFTGIGAVAAAGIGKSVAEAGITEMLKGPFGKVAGQASALAAAFAIGVALIDLVASKAADAQRAEVGASIQEGNTRSKIAAAVRSGHTIAPELRAKMESEAEDKRKQALALRNKKYASEMGGIDSYLGLGGGDDVATDRSKAQDLEREASHIESILQQEAAQAQKAAAELQKEAAERSEATAKALKAALEVLQPKKTARGTPMSDRS